MTTMTAISGHIASRGHRTHAPARPAHDYVRTVRTTRDAILAGLPRATPVAAAAMRLALALVPVSALAGMFVWL